MTVTSPDPQRVREASLEALHRLRLPLPPPNFPLAWEPGDLVELRAEDAGKLPAALSVARDAVTLSDTPPPSRPLILDRIS